MDSRQKAKFDAYHIVVSELERLVVDTDLLSPEESDSPQEEKHKERVKSEIRRIAESFKRKAEKLK